MPITRLYGVNSTVAWPSSYQSQNVGQLFTGQTSPTSQVHREVPPRTLSLFVISEH